MGEILRATLEQSCVFSRPKFYGARLVVPASTQIGLQRSTVTTFDKLGWFLLTSFYVGSTGTGTLGTSGFGLTSFGNNMQLQDVQTGKFFYESHPVNKGGPPGVQVGSFATSQVELSEYPLFGPGERIRWIYTLQVFLTGSPGADYADILYSGIEYLMPGGPSYGQASP
jgi:hypothetical protein